MWKFSQNSLNFFSRWEKFEIVDVFSLKNALENDQKIENENCKVFNLKWLNISMFPQLNSQPQRMPKAAKNWHF